MKKEDITGLIVYLIIIALAVIFGFTVLQTHNSESSLQGFQYVLYIIGAVVVGAVFNGALFELGHVVGAKIGKYNILSVCILGLCFYKDNGKTKLKFSSFDGLTGETKIVPKEGMVDKANPYPYLFFGSLFFVVEAIVVMVVFSRRGPDVTFQDRYEIIGRVGSGGMADVYKATDHRLNRSVAVKVLKNEYSSDLNFVSKFRGEAQAAAGLQHPNVVNVYDVLEVLLRFVERVVSVQVFRIW